MINLATYANEYEGLTKEDHKTMVDYYNANCIKLVKPNRRYKMKYSDSWCAMFTSVVAHKMGLSSDLFPYEVSVMQQIEIAKAAQCWTTDVKKVRAGDLITFSFGGLRADHVGFVESVNKGMIATVEGNKGGTVGSRNIIHTHTSILGFILI